MFEICLEKFIKCYGVVEVFYGIDLYMVENEFIVLVGLLGCGKFIILWMIVGFEEVLDGEIYIDGQFVSYLEFKDCNFVMVFQDYVLYLYMDVVWNIFFVLCLQKCLKDEIEVKVKEVVDIVGFIDFLICKSGVLFGG